MINPVALEIFGIYVYWYGIVYSLGFLFSFFFLKFHLKEIVSEEKFENIYFYFMIFSVIGGRVFEVVFYNPLFYWKNPLMVFAVWNGGMSIHGGILFGILSLWFFSKKYKVSFWELIDWFSIPLAFFLAIGRIANFINQELVGVKTNFFLGIVFESVDEFVRHPVQLYASFKNIVVFEIVYFMKVMKSFKPGVVGMTFLVFYNLGRFFIDFLRVPTRDLGVISLGQLFCLVFAGVGMFVLCKLSRK